VKKLTTQTKSLVLTALLTAIVTVMTFINIPLFGAQGGLIHLGYVALFPIAIIYGKRVGMIAGGVGMGLFDILSGWSAWAPGTLLIVGVIGYVVGQLTESNQSYLVMALAMVIGSLISITGYFFYNAFIMGFGVESALVSVTGDSLKVFASTIITLLIIRPLRQLKLAR
jgi:uncharacterized membrane protein